MLLHHHSIHNHHRLPYVQSFIEQKKFVEKVRLKPERYCIKSESQTKLNILRMRLFGMWLKNNVAKPQTHKARNCDSNKKTQFPVYCYNIIHHLYNSNL